MPLSAPWSWRAMGLAQSWGIGAVAGVDAEPPVWRAGFSAEYAAVRPMTASAIPKANLRTDMIELLDIVAVTSPFEPVGCILCITVPTVETAADHRADGQITNSLSDHRDTPRGAA